MNVAISGSRTFTDSVLVESVVERVIDRGDRVLVGDASFGVDRFVRHWLEDAGIPKDRWSVYEAHWRHEGRLDKGAGHKRNAEMVADADELIAIFAPGERTGGTKNALEAAERKGIPVHVYENGAWAR